MGVSERSEFLVWYEEQKFVVFNNRQTLESYCQDDVTVLRQTCQVLLTNSWGSQTLTYFRNPSLLPLRPTRCCGNFLKPDTIGLIPTVGYTGNKNYSPKAIMWLVYREQTDGCHIRHGRNGRDFTLPELPNFRVNVFCAEPNTVYEFNGCYWHGHSCRPFLDTYNGRRHISWEVRQNHGPVGQNHRSRVPSRSSVGMWIRLGYIIRSPGIGGTSHCTARATEYEGRPVRYLTEAMRLHYKAAEGETVQYLDVMFLYSHI
jgi:hypothetical protein